MDYPCGKSFEEWTLSYGWSLEKPFKIGFILDRFMMEEEWLYEFSARWYDYRRNKFTKLAKYALAFFMDEVDKRKHFKDGLRT